MSAGKCWVVGFGEGNLEADSASSVHGLAQIVKEAAVVVAAEVVAAAVDGEVVVAVAVYGEVVVVAVDVVVAVVVVDGEVVVVAAAD